MTNKERLEVPVLIMIWEKRVKILFALLLLVLSACVGNDSNPVASKTLADLLIGSWDIYKLDAISNDTTITQEKPNISGTLSFGSGMMSITLNAPGRVPLKPMVGAYTVVNNVIVSGGDTFEVELTGNRLILTIPLTIEGEGNVAVKIYATRK